MTAPTNRANVTMAKPTPTTSTATWAGWVSAAINCGTSSEVIPALKHRGRASTSAESRNLPPTKVAIPASDAGGTARYVRVVNRRTLSARSAVRLDVAARVPATTAVDGATRAETPPARQDDALDPRSAAGSV